MSLTIRPGTPLINRKIQASSNITFISKIYRIKHRHVNLTILKTSDHNSERKQERKPLKTYVNKQTLLIKSKLGQSKNDTSSSKY